MQDPGAAAYQSRLDRSLQNMLDTVLGPGNSTVTTIAEFDPAGTPSPESWIPKGLAPTVSDDQPTRNNAVNEIDEIRPRPPGAVTRLQVNVRIFATPIDPAQVEQLVSAAAGIDPARGDTITVVVEAPPPR